MATYHLFLLTRHNSVSAWEQYMGSTPTLSEAKSNAEDLFLLAAPQEAEVLAVSTSGDLMLVAEGTHEYGQPWQWKDKNMVYVRNEDGTLPTVAP